jgi:hypothetical protein
MITLLGDSANVKTMQLSTVPVFSNLIEAAALCVRPRSKRGRTNLYQSLNSIG